MADNPASPEPVRDELDQEGLEAAAKALCRVSSKGRCSESCLCNNADEYGFVPDARAAILAYKEWEREREAKRSAIAKAADSISRNQVPPSPYDNPLMKASDHA